MADPRDALVSINFRPGIDALIRQWQTEAEQIKAGAMAAHVEAAEKMQATALGKLRASLKRPQRETKYLERAVERADFIHIDEHGWTFATEAFTQDPTINSYWRGIEFGSRKFLGRTIQGFFRDTGGRPWPASTERIRQDPRLIQVRGGRFGFPITIKHEIEKVEFLQETIREYESGLIDQIYRRHLGRWMN